MAKLRPWLLLIVFASMMLAAYLAIIRASREAQIKEVPLVKSPQRP